MGRVHSSGHGRRARVEGSAFSFAALLGVGALFASLFAATAGGLSAAAASSTPTATVPQGINPALDPAAQDTGPTPSSTPMNVSFILNGRNLPQLEQQVTAGWKGPYLSTSQFAAQYGQTPQVVTALQTYLKSFGISTTAYADDLDVAAVGTAGQFDRALAILLHDYTVPNHNNGRFQHVYASRSNPVLPTSLSADILSVLGLTSYQPFASQAKKAAGGRVGLTPASNAAIPAGQLTPGDFVNHYGLGSVEASGAVGQGQSIGILTVASLDPSVPTTFWRLLGLHTPANRISIENLDGGAGAVSLDNGSDETTLDVEQSGAIAPQSKIIVYQAPNTDNGLADAFYAAASENAAGSVSVSWGESDTYAQLSEINGIQSPTFAQSFDEAELELAAQGQSDFAASGDYGAYMAAWDAGTTNLSSIVPADGPYITATGGTTLAGTQSYSVLDASGDPTNVTQSVTIPKEIGWSWDYEWPLFATAGYSSEAQAATDPTFDEVGGGGGGYSVFESEPSYQRGVSGVNTYTDIPYLTPTTVTEAQGLPLPTAFSFNPTPHIATGTSNGGRATPDLSYDADPNTGYSLYDPQLQAVYGSNFVLYGGTSFVAPQLNAVTAVMESALGHRIGFWNPVIYAAAQSSRSPFASLSENQVYGSQYFSQTNANGTTSPLSGSFSSNDSFYTGTPGTLYNPSTGLGYANLSALMGFFAH
jgi:kumamolisin